MFEEGEQGDDDSGDTVQDEGVVDDIDQPRERLLLTYCRPLPI